MLKYLTVADLISVFNASFGFLALVALLAGSLTLSFVFIILALLADGLDGVVARRVGFGETGGHLEAMADMLSLSIAPLAFLYLAYRAATADLVFHAILLICALLFVFSSAVRLSSFHLLRRDGAFIGLPASASTLIMLGVGLLQVPAWVVPPLILLLALLGMSSVPFPKLSLSMTIVASIVIMLSAVLGGLNITVGPMILLAAIGLYVVLGPLYLRRKERVIHPS